MVTFTPQAMQLYSAAFEATMEGTSRYNIFRHERVICLFLSPNNKLCHLLLGLADLCSRALCDAE